MGKGLHAGVHVNTIFFVSSLSDASSRSDPTAAGAAVVREPALRAGSDAPDDQSRSFHTRCDVLQLCTCTFRCLPLCYRPQMQSVPSWLALEEGALLLLLAEALGESQLEWERRVLLAAQQQPVGLGRPSRDGNSCQEVYSRMQQQDTQNTDSFSGFSPMCDEEVPRFHFPMGGADRHPAGGALGVDGWVWPPAQHAVSTDKFFPALFSLLGVTKSHWNVQMPVKIMINPDFGTYGSAPVCVVKADGRMGLQWRGLCWPEGAEKSVRRQLWLLRTVGLQERVITLMLLEFTVALLKKNAFSNIFWKLFLKKN